MALLGVDTGGTFTDFVLVDAGRVRLHKVLSTPEAPEQAIIAGVRALGLELEGLELVHGSTVATNTLLEGKGARTALVTNQGLRDLLTIGRQARRQLYALQPAAVAPPVPAVLCLEAPGRLAADGSELEGQPPAAMARLREALAALGPESVAVNLLFSFRDPRHEHAVAALAPPGAYVCCSADVLPAQGEYERGIATWINAAVGPRVQAYLQRLEQALAPARVQVMQSTGRTAGVEEAGRTPVNLVLSGPAGGLIGATHVGALAGDRRLLSFDMGGTSTDVALLDGGPAFTDEARIGPYPLGVPTVDMHTIGAGGGSIAWVDPGGLLRVGPESAGAAPGPACYGRGGRAPTVTDANVLLGRLPASARLAGGMALHRPAAEAAMATVAEALRLGLEAAAEGVVRVANELMAEALRVISVRRGIDPRDFVLLGFGGAGGMHVCALAEALEMRRVVVPAHAGVLSALGMVVAPPGRERVRSIARPLSGCTGAGLDEGFAALRREAEQTLLAEGWRAGDIEAVHALDVCYEGQSYTLRLPWRGMQALESDFHAAHERRYGHRLALPLELVNLRVGLSVAVSPPTLPAWQAGPCARLAPAPVHGLAQPVPVLPRRALHAGEGLSGPVIILDEVASTWVAPGWRVELDGLGSLHLTARG